MKLLLIILIIFVYYFIDSLLSLIKINKFENEYKDYVVALGTEEKYLGKFIEHKNEIVELFEKANIKHPSVTFTQPKGYGFVANGVVDVFENMQADNMDIASSVMKSFSVARGEFKHRIAQCFNLLYWIEVIILLPKKIVKFLGLIQITLGLKYCN